MTETAKTNKGHLATGSNHSLWMLSLMKMPRRTSECCDAEGETRVVTADELANHINSEMDRIWRNTDPGITKELQCKLEQNRQLCFIGIGRD